MRIYSRETKPSDIALKVYKKWKNVQQAHGHDEIGQVCIAMWATRKEVQRVPGRLGVPADLVAPAQVSFKLTPGEKADKNMMEAQIKTIAGAQDGEMKGNKATAYLNLNFLRIDTIRQNAKMCDYEIEMTSHELVKIRIREKDERFDKLVDLLFNQKGVISMKPSKYMAEVTTVSPKGELTERALKKLVEAAGCTFESVTFER